MKATDVSGQGRRGSIWEFLRLQFPVAERVIYLNHAAVAPLPILARQRMEAYLDELVRIGALNYPKAMLEPVARLRSLAAELLGCGPDRVFMVKSTTEGLAVVATGLDWRAGDNVVLVEGEFPANIRPWLPLSKRDVEIRFVPQRGGRVLLEDLAEAVDPRTRVVSVSFVQYLSGFRLDLGAVAEICRRVDALLVVDAIQGLGVFDLDVERDGIDFLSADGHKWLCGPEGAGLGYVSDRALERIEPAVQGWMAVERPFDFADIEQPLKSTAARFEPGAYNLAGIHGLGGSLELLLAVGVPALSDRILALTDLAAELLEREGWEILSPRRHEGEKSGILTFQRPGLDARAAAAHLVEAGVKLSARGGALRISPHAYNTFEEIERFVALLGQVGR